jgi:hypothetical protein
MGYSDLEVVRGAAILQEKLDRLSAHVHAGLPADDLNVEFCLLRTILSIQRGETTLDEMLSRPLAG